MGSERLTNVPGIHKKNFENSSEHVCDLCERKIKNSCNNLEFLSKRFESDQKDNVGSEFEIVYVRARKQSDIEFNHNRLVVPQADNPKDMRACDVVLF